MYLDHFQFNKEPFGTAPDPDCVWLGGRHARVFETLLEGLHDHEGCLILTGDIGTGKTALVKRIARQDGLAAFFFTAGGPELSGLDIYRLLAAELRMDPGFDRPEEFVEGFSRLLREAAGKNKSAVLIIDEAQRLASGALKGVAALAARTANGKCLLKLLMAGSPELDSKAGVAANEGLLPGIAVRCVLEPLTDADTQAYIAYRLKAAGRERPLFSDEAVRAIRALSKGLPRLINIICDHALLYGYSANLQWIDSDVIRECSRDLSVALDLEELPQDRPAVVAPAPQPQASLAPTARPPRGAWRPLVYLAAALATAAGFLYFTMR
jgi:type II secretory pathway predicted ATPase ExeA